MSCSSKNQRFIVAMVTDLPSHGYFQKLGNLTWTILNLILCKSVRYSRMYDDSNTVEQIY